MTDYSDAAYAATPPIFEWRHHRRRLRQLAAAAQREHHDHRQRHERQGGPRGRHGFGAFFGGGPWFATRRASRGDIRAAILALLLERPMHGYQIIQEIEARSQGAWRVSPGSVYPTLQQLQDEGLVRAVEEDGGRRVFELTESGRTEAAAVSSPPPWEEVAGGVDNDVVAMRDLIFQVSAAAWQVTKAGTSKQVSDAHDLMRETRRRLYQLLAEDPGQTG